MTASRTQRPPAPIDLDVEQPLGAVAEVLRVGLHVEAHQIAREQPAQDLPRVGQHPEDVEGRERHV
jgi:hypothetical protein